MSGDYGNDIITITDDDGNEFELEHLDTVELGDAMYMAFLPTDVSEDDEEYGMVILKVEIEDNEECLLTVDDEDELEAAYNAFMLRLSDEEES